MKKSNIQKNHMKNFLIILLVFLSIGALYGGIGFIIQPDGSLFEMDTSC